MILFFKTFILPIHGSAYDPFSVYMRGFVVNLYLLHQNRQKIALFIPTLYLFHFAEVF